MTEASDCVTPLNMKCSAQENPETEREGDPCWLGAAGGGGGGDQGGTTNGCGFVLGGGGDRNVLDLGCGDGRISL